MFRQASITAAFLILTAASPAWSQEGGKPEPEAPVKPPEEVLPRPLRRFDENKDGKLTGEELRLARQAHNRGGRRAEPDEGQWNETLNRLKNDWRRRRMAELDLSDNGELDDAEKKRADQIWAKIAKGILSIHDEMVRKYDQNDDGELTNEERGASRRESEELRRELEQEMMDKAQADAEKAQSSPEKPEAAPDAKKAEGQTGPR